MRHGTVIRLALVASALLGACASDLTPVAAPAAASVVGPDESKVEQGLTIQTRFEIVGWDAATDVLDVERMALNVGAVFLEPVSDDASMASFANREPFVLEFAPYGGETSQLGPEMILPYGGTFAVSVQFEPPSAFDGDKGLHDDASVVVDGRWSPSVNAAEDDDNQFEPSPLPCFPKDGDGRVAFSYRSDAVARFQVEEIDLDGEGVYELVVTLDVSDWLEETIVPALRGALTERRRGDVSQRFSQNFFDQVEDVSNDESVGIEGLFGGMGVTTRRY